MLPTRALRLFLIVTLLVTALAVVQARASAATTITVGEDGCTLADAITAANTDAEAGNCPAGDGADTIVLEDGAVYTLTQALADDSFWGPSGLPFVTSDVTIEGNGATIQRADDAPSFRIMTQLGGVLTVRDLTFRDGFAEAGDKYQGWGGCLFASGGTLEIVGSTFTGCFARTSSAALHADSMITSISRSTFSNNGTNDPGNRTAVIRNAASVFTTSTLTMVNSTLSDNVTGTGVAATDWGVVNLTNVTITGQHSASIHSGWGSTTNFRNSILVPGYSGSFGETYNDLGNNLVIADPLIGLLQDNGGTTLTRLPLAGSLAIDGASDCPATDQRGVNRPQGGTCDIGAVELEDDTPPVITPVINGTPGTNDWYTSDVDVSWTLTEPESRVTQSTGCDAVSVTTDTFGKTFTCTATSVGGPSTKSVTIKRDTLDPVLSPSVTPNLIAVDTSATASANADDSLSGIATQGCDPLDLASAGEKSVTCTATDRAGNTATATATYTVYSPDTTGPVIIASLTGERGDNLWFTGVANVTWFVMDPESEVLNTEGCGDTSVDFDTTGATITCTATSKGGTSTGSVTIMRDATPPTLAPVVSPNPVAIFTPATASANASDVTSDIATQGCDAVDTSQLGEHNVTCWATDNAGNTTTTQVSYTVFDPTPPVITPTVNGTLGNNDWYISDVNVSWTVEDPESDISASDGCGPTTISTDTTGTTLTCTATSAGGTSTKSVTIPRDVTAPLISVTGVADGAVYILGSVPSAGCQTTDVTSGVATDAGLQLTGGTPTGIGTYTATCAGAIDNAGHQGAAQSATYKVIYPFAWRSDVTAYPHANRVKAGDPLHVRFSLGGDFGLEAVVDGFPAMQWRSCSSGQPLGDPVPAELVSSLRYAGGGYYQVVVRTRATDVNRCGDVVLALNDGTQHALRFMFTKDR